MPQFNPQNDIPSLAGKVFLVTGGNSGLGETAVAAIARHSPKRIYLASRSLDKAEEAMSRIRATSTAAQDTDIAVLQLDLASLESVRTAAARVNAETDRLDGLQLNAGVGMVLHSTTKEGYEIHMGTNYLGHALLTQLLMPKLLATARLPGSDVRIVSVSSTTHRVFGSKEGICFDELRGSMANHGGAELYAQANLAKILLAYELSKRYPQITSSSMHPGGVRTALWSGPKSVNGFLNQLFMQPMIRFLGVSVDEGVKGQLWCNFGQGVQSGTYYDPVGKIGKGSEFIRDDAMSARLWAWTEKELASHGAPGWVEPDNKQ